MIGTGPAAQLAAYYAAGVTAPRLADVYGLAPVQVLELVLGYQLHAGAAEGLTLVSIDGVCRVGGCGRPAVFHRLCRNHLDRLYRRLPVWKRSMVRAAAVRTCSVCGAQWCDVTSRPRPKTCGSRACLAAVRARSRAPAPAAARNAEIAARAARGESQMTIAADYGLTPARVGHIANRAGVYVRRPYARRPGPAR